MKRHLLINAVAIICMALVSCTINIDGESLGGKTIKGDGNIVSRDYDVSAFDELSVALPATVNFTVADDYTCTIRVDENILEYLDIEVDDNTLFLKRQKEHKTVNLRATTFVIDVTAPRLEDIDLAGSGTINVLSPLEGEEMDVNLAGSGDIGYYGNPVVEGDKVGSGSMTRLGD